MVERLSKQKAEKEEEHVVKIKEVIVELKSNVPEAIWVAKFKLTEDVKCRIL